MAQVVFNILDNFVRFVKEGAVTISIDTNSTVASDMDDNDDGIRLKGVTISIKDSGKGIDHEIQPRLISKFIFRKTPEAQGWGCIFAKVL